MIFLDEFLRKEFFFALLTFLAHDGRLFTILKHAWFHDLTENTPLQKLPKCSEIVWCYFQKSNYLDSPFFKKLMYITVFWQK